MIIGDEILRGKTYDKQVGWLGRELVKHQLLIDKVVIIPDQIDLIIQELKDSKDKYTFIVTSGGLGPTLDDVTKEAVFAAFKKEGVVSLENKIGSAPALASYNKTCASLLVLPGVPREFQHLFKAHFTRDKFNIVVDTDIKHDCFICKTYGVQEEKIFFEKDLTLWEDLSKFGAVGSYPQFAGVDIHVNFTYRGNEELQMVIQKLRERFEKSSISPAIYYLGPFATLGEIVSSTLRDSNQTLSIAESATGGLITHMLTQIPGASDVLIGSIICYHESVKIEQLKVNPSTINQFGITSTEVASEMARGCIEAFHSSWAISVTGVAGPAGGSDQTPVGTVCIGLSNGKEIWSTKLFSRGGERIKNKNSFAHMALIFLLKTRQNK